jgi:tetratricopeptide (TPR) repeat protein
MEAWAAHAADRSNAAANVAYAHRLFAQSLLAGGDSVAALAEARKARALDEQAQTAPSAKSAYAMETSLDLQLMATCYLRMNQLTDASDFLHRAAELRWSVFRSNPGDEWVEHRLLSLLVVEGWVEESQGDMAAAQATYHEAAKLAPTMTAAQPNEEWNSALGFVYASEGLMLKRAGKTTAACELFQRSAGYFRGMQMFDEAFYERRANQVTKELAACPA